MQAVLEVREPNSSSVRLTWSAAGPKARYDVEVDGVKIATDALSKPTIYNSIVALGGMASSTTGGVKALRVGVLA